MIPSDTDPSVTASAAAAASMPSGPGKALKPSSVQVYDKALRHFREVFGGEVPCDRQTVDRYITSMQKGSPSTAYLRVQAVRHAHLQLGHPSPTDEPDLRAVLRSLQLGVFPGKSRSPRKRREPRQARPLTRGLLTKMLDAMGINALDRRDRCLLLLGFAAGLSRTALVDLDVADVSFTSDAMLLALRNPGSETARVVAVPRTGHELCAARATTEWMQHSELDVQGGPLIRRFDRAGNPTSERLDAAYLGQVIKRRLHAVGIDPKPYSSLSLVRGRRAELSKGLL